MMKKGFAGVLAAWMLAVIVPAAQAGEQRVVVELFTSQGCYSCPPADKLLREISGRDDFLPLAFHTDHWDYIGWKDTFASPAYTRRHRSYARQAHSRPYTPQMFVGGQVELIGARPMKLLDSVRDLRAKTNIVEIDLSRRGNRLRIEADRTSRLRGPVMVQLVRFTPESTVRITRGENRGKTLTYTNIVTEFRTVETWNGRSPLNLAVPIEGDAEVAVFLQYDGPGAVVGSALLN